MSQIQGRAVSLPTALLCSPEALWALEGAFPADPGWEGLHPAPGVWHFLLKGQEWQAPRTHGADEDEAAHGQGPWRSSRCGLAPLTRCPPLAQPGHPARSPPEACVGRPFASGPQVDASVRAVVGSELGGTRAITEVLMSAPPACWGVRGPQRRGLPGESFHPPAEAATSTGELRRERAPRLLG